MNEFKRDFIYLLSGFMLVFRPKIRSYAIIPLFVNIFLFAIVIFYAVSRFENFIAALEVQWQWLEWLSWLIWTFFFIGLSIVIFFCFSIIANLISAPFNSLLAKAVEESLMGKKLESNTEQSLLNLTITSVQSEFQKLLYFSIRIPILLVLFFIPILNIAAPLIWFVFGSWMIAIEYCDYPMNNSNIQFKKLRTRLAAKRQLAYGFGAGAMLVTLIPVLNFFVIPVAVAGATRMCIESIGLEP